MDLSNSAHVKNFYLCNDDTVMCFYLSFFCAGVGLCEEMGKGGGGGGGL